MLEAAHGLRMCNEDCDFLNDQKTTSGAKWTAVTEKLTPTVVKFKQIILHSYALTICKRSRLYSDVFAKTDTVALSDGHFDYGPFQCPSIDSLFQIDDEDLHRNRFN